MCSSVFLRPKADSRNSSETPDLEPNPPEAALPSKGCRSDLSQISVLAPGSPYSTPRHELQSTFWGQSQVESQYPRPSAAEVVAPLDRCLVGWWLYDEQTGITCESFGLHANIHDIEYDIFGSPQVRKNAAERQLANELDIPDFARRVPSSRRKLANEARPRLTSMHESPNCSRRHPDPGRVGEAKGHHIGRALLSLIIYKACSRITTRFTLTARQV